VKEKVLEKLKAHFSDAIESVNEYRGELTVVVKKSSIKNISLFLRDDAELRFDSLRDVCGADYYRPDERFEVIYNLYSIPNNFRLRLKVRVDESDLHVDSVTSVWPTSNWAERETYDMFGILFDGHPDLRRIYMPEGFEHFPLRKDFPLMGIPGSLSLPRK
jgi:NADH-quinone oxidoreductase subunit C